MGKSDTPTPRKDPCQFFPNEFGAAPEESAAPTPELKIKRRFEPYSAAQQGEQNGPRGTRAANAPAHAHNNRNPMTAAHTKAHGPTNK
jgi:hypothetical protein